MESARDFIRRTSEKFDRNLSQYKEDHKESRLNWFPDINRRGKYGVLRVAWTFMKQSNIDEKVLTIERFKLKKMKEPVSHKNLEVGNIEYRFGYYMVGKNGIRKNKWIWGQSCPIIPRQDFNKLLNKARREGTIS